MAMATATAAFVLRRKIIEDSIDVTYTAQLCTIQCDPHDNPTGFCSTVCTAVCPSFCRTTDPSPAPSSPPPEATVFTLDTPHSHSSLSLPLKISLAVLVATFSLFLLYTLYKSCTVWYQSRRRRRRRRRTAPPPSPENRDTRDEFLDHDVLDHPVWYIRTVGLQPSAIGAITVVKFTKTDGPVEASFCPVCLSEFQENEMLRLLPKCNHAFHIACIDTWLSSHTNCPLCRAGIVKNPANSLSPEQNVEDSGRADETHVGISILEEGFEGERQTEDGVESSGLRIGEEHVNGAGEFLIMRRSVSLDDVASSRVRFDVVHNYSHSIDGDLGIELVKIDRITNSRGV